MKFQADGWDRRQARKVGRAGKGKDQKKQGENRTRDVSKPRREGKDNVSESDADSEN